MARKFTQKPGSGSDYLYGLTRVTPLRTNETNMIWLMTRAGHPAALVVDPTESAPVERALTALGLTLAAILITHHHADHVGGNLELRGHFGCEVLCSPTDIDRVPAATRDAKEAELQLLGNTQFETFATPGHTAGHIVWYNRADGLLFTGDTLFAFGCGRIFEGTAKQLHHSLNRIRSLPGETRLFFGHEYSEVNAAFANDVDPANKLIGERLERIRRELDETGVAEPPTLFEELATNPFLRANDPAIRRRLGLEQAPEVKVFARLRELKDGFHS